MKRFDGDLEQLEAEIKSLAKSAVSRKRYFDPRRKIGSMFRSNDEVLDLIEIIKPFEKVTMFRALCGGRARWNTFEKPPMGVIHYIERNHAKTISDNIAEEVCRRLPTFPANKSMSDKIDLSGYGLPYIVPYSAFLHDIDVLLIANGTNITNSFIPLEGRRSGTTIELFFVSPAVVAGVVDRRSETEMFRESMGILL